MMNKRVTIADVAEEAGVSMMTVSRAINHKEGISEDTRLRILEIAERLGYRPSGVARALATNRSCSLGLVIPDVANPFFSQIVRGAEDLAYDSGYNVFLVNTAEDTEREEAALESLLEKHVDGVIWCSSRLPTESVNNYTDSFPFTVLINREINTTQRNYATINVDDSLGAQKAISFFTAQGHTKIGLIAGPEGSTSSQRRRTGYQKGLVENNIAYRPELIINCEPRIESGYQATKQLLSTYENISAILAYNDLVAFGVFQACEEIGKRIPEEISVIGFDDIPLASIVKPRLSTLRTDKRGLGRLAMKTLIQLIEGDEAVERNITIQPTLILRESTTR
jgi:LacI family transcriptional regulator